MPDRLTPAERDAIASYTGPVTICPKGPAMGGYGDPIQPRDAMNIQIRSRQQGARLRTADRRVEE